jgi:hypothetical protein
MRSKKALIFERTYRMEVQMGTSYDRNSTRIPRWIQKTLDEAKRESIFMDRIELERRDEPSFFKQES